MIRTRRTRKTNRYVPERDLMTYMSMKKTLDFRPHCFVQPLALMETKRFDDAMALAQASAAYGEES